MSASWFDRACKSLPGGNTRHTVFFAPYPIYARSGSGCHVVDIDGIDRVDYVNNYSSLVHGHCHPAIVKAVREQILNLSAVGLPTISEVLLAELLVDRVPSADQIRFTNSGTEAVMMAIKAARSLTGRPAIAKIEGTYHGAYDFAEVSQESTPENWGPASKPATTPLYWNTPDNILHDVLTLPFNDIASARSLLDANHTRIAAVLIDVMPSRLSYLALSQEFVRMIRDVTSKYGILLIMDEVYSFRLGPNGAQEIFSVSPDLTTLAKIIGGGFPVGAVAGPKKNMEVFDAREQKPRVPHGGTYNGNPVTMAAGLTGMQLLDDAAFQHLNDLGDFARDAIRKVISGRRAPAQVLGQSSLFSIVPKINTLRSNRDLFLTTRQKAFQEYIHRYCLQRGVLTTPSTLFTLSTPMGRDHIDLLVEVLDSAFESAMSGSCAI